MSRTRYEWTVLDFAIWAAGGQTVPVYATSSAEQIEWIVRDSGARFVIVETPENAATAARPRTAAPPRTAARAGSWTRARCSNSPPWAGSIADEEVTKRRAALTPDTVATVCYTSGTTGRPKGCVLTHANLHAEAANTVELLHPIFKEVTGQIASTLLFLPLAHILGRTLQIACLMARIELGHCPSIKPDELRPALREFRPTFLVGVPYLFEKIHDTGRATAEKIGRGASFDRAAPDRASASARHTWTGSSAAARARGPGLYAAWALYDLLVYRRIRKELGGRAALRHQRRLPARPRPQPLLLRRRNHRLRGLRPDRDHRRGDDRPAARPRPGTVGLPVPGTADPHRRRRRGPHQGRHRLRRLLEQPGRRRTRC